MKFNDKTPPRSAKRVFRVADLPNRRAPARYSITRENGRTEAYVIDKRRRQVLDLLIDGPVYCASPVRLSDIVHVLKREVGLEVHTEYYPGDRGNGIGAYGVYFLKSLVERFDDGLEYGGAAHLTPPGATVNRTATDGEVAR